MRCRGLRRAGGWGHGRLRRWRVRRFEQVGAGHGDREALLAVRSLVRGRALVPLAEVEGLTGRTQLRERAGEVALAGVLAARCVDGGHGQRAVVKDLLHQAT